MQTPLSSSHSTTTKTMELILLLVLFPVTLSVEHSLIFDVTLSPGHQTFPEFLAVSKVDGVQVTSCDSNNKAVEPRQVWVKKLLDSEPQHLQLEVQSCLDASQDSTVYTEDFKQHFNVTTEVCFFQVISGCELDNETGEVSGYNQFGYDGEEFMSLDLKTLAWQYTERAVSLKQKWDRDKARLLLSNNFFKNICPQWLKKYLDYGRRFLQRKDLPSVSLLQKTSSSPVTCHATGFYPNRADLFWRKDGEELHEDVDKGEILPNHDGTFQMSVDLNISSIAPEDWKKYDCMFQMSGVKDDIITKLDKSVIRTNWVPPSGFPAGAVIGVVVGLLLLLLCIAGLFMWRKKTNGFRPANTSDSGDRHSDPI
ncbi:major histocompatibility complex class I-related gene protein-like isoform X1 [Acanthochromis polyacanthus]|uniref:major histocompatibility complex class I-related gene protein-like isoform X1 n=1 Tax=Acanthochromis polyacanthus TaxID=80966 RepID=UPI0022342EC9|nr:major histocompatibility complex class I-related gene protein-like isoform X1 [Acanthochromis polyacanthus]